MGNNHGMYLHTVFNQSGRNVSLEQRGKTSWNLSQLQNHLDVKTEHLPNDFQMVHDLRRRTTIQIYDDGGWNITIVMKQEGKNDLTGTWNMPWGTPRYNITVEVDKIWIYGDLTMNGKAAKAWVAHLFHNAWVWDVYTIEG